MRNAVHKLAAVAVAAIPELEKIPLAICKYCCCFCRVAYTIVLACVSYARNRFATILASIHNVSVYPHHFYPMHGVYWFYRYCSAFFADSKINSYFHSTNLFQFEVNYSKP